MDVNTGNSGEGGGAHCTEVHGLKEKRLVWLVLGRENSPRSFQSNNRKLAKSLSSHK